MAVAGEGESEEREIDAGEVNGGDKQSIINAMAGMNRKEKRKTLKKIKRKQLRRERAIKEREEEEARLNDPEEQMRLLRLEQEEFERMERDRFEFEERERQFLLELERKKKLQEEKEEEERNRKVDDDYESQSKLVDNENTNELNEGDEWEYVEEGPAEIIWKGNEIIVKKKKVRVPKKDRVLPIEKQESERPISNPLAPQSEAYEDYRSAQEVLESVAQQVPNFGTEQDKAHCPFHLKTGVCRFGARCSRVHFYPDKSCTLLMKNMYNGPGLAFEQDEGLEYTDEEVERSFEDFYEDVHTEFLKFGEIVNFKVCKNASSHLRGNVYVHYKLLESAVLAYQSINGRFFAGKQISCDFVNVTRWKVAICGEYMKSRLKTCSRGSACNFIHCFRNPGGDYEWADLDKPAPRYWLKKMAALFGCTTDRFGRESSPGYLSRRSRSRGSDSGNFSDEDDDRKRGCLRKRRVYDRGASYHDEDMLEDKRISYNDYHVKHCDNGDISDRDSNDSKFSTDTMRSSRKRERDPESRRRSSKSRRHGDYSDRKECSQKGVSGRYLEHKKRMIDYICSRHKGSGKDYNSDLKQNPNIDNHGDNRHKGGDSLSKRKKEKSSDIDSDGDRLSKDEDRRHIHRKKNSRTTKKEAESSGSGSHGGSYGRDEKSHQKNSRISRSKSGIADADSNREKLEKEEEHHRHRRRSSRHHSNDKFEISSADSDREKLEKEEKHHRHRRRSSRHHSKDKFEISSADSDREKLEKEEKHHRHRRSSRHHSKDKFGIPDADSDREKLEKEEEHHRHRRRSSRCHSKDKMAKADSDAYRCSVDGDKPKEKEEAFCSNGSHLIRKNYRADLDGSRSDEDKVDGMPQTSSCPNPVSCVTDLDFQDDKSSRYCEGDKFHDSCTEGCKSERRHKSCGQQRSQISSESNENNASSHEAGAVDRQFSSQGIYRQSETELEQAYRLAALKKLEEMKKFKDTPVENSEHNETREIDSHDNLLQDTEVGEDMKKLLCSSKVDRDAASTKRRRI